MKIEKKRLADLTPSERNVRRHNSSQIKELVKAVDAFGVIRPIICDENGVILCGHGLYQALTARGDEVADCVVMVGLTEKQKTKLMLADNKIYDLGTSDYDAIDEILTEFGQEGDFSIPGYDAETLEDLYGIKSVEKSASQIPALQDYVKEDVQQTPVPVKDPTPSNRVVEERAKADAERRVIVCPHCGEMIEI